MRHVNWSLDLRKKNVIGTKCYIKRDDDIGNLDPTSDEGMFLGYSLKKNITNFLIIELRQLLSVQMWN